MVTGILAHVDAGKTTLSEAVLYYGGAIQQVGRVDHKNAFLDTDAMERERGITIKSQAVRIVYKAKDRGGISLVTTLPAPMTQPSPMVTPGHTTTEEEIDQALEAVAEVAAVPAVAENPA